MLLAELAKQWDAGALVERLAQKAWDITKGSEHHVIRYMDDGGSRRVMKATFAGKYGRYEYSPTLYLNSLRLVQTLVESLDIRIHGIFYPEQSPSIVTSMRFIPADILVRQKLRPILPRWDGLNITTEAKRWIS